MALMPQAPREKKARVKSSKAIARGVAVSLALGKLSCVEPAPPEPAPPPPPTAAKATSAPPALPPTAIAAPEPPPAPAPPDPSPALSPYRVTNASYVRRVLYTWTTPEQIDELLRTRVLLSRSESPTYGPSYFDRVLATAWKKGDKLAALLQAPAFKKARFAWTAPWATFLGFPGESYGDQLIAVTLKPEAILLMYRTSTLKWEARDMNDQVVPEAKVMLKPERIAGVFFVHDSVSPPASGSVLRASASDGREAYREYVLCNEAMIESWSVGTEAIAAEMKANADAVDAAAKYFEAYPPPAQRADRWNAHVALLVWPGIVPATNAKELFEAALAFPNQNYVIDVEPLRKLSARLREIRQRAVATTEKPSYKFPGAKPVPIPKDPPPTYFRRAGTY